MSTPSTSIPDGAGAQAPSVDTPHVDASAPVRGTPAPRLALALGLRPALIIACGASLIAMGRAMLWMNVLIVVIDIVTLVLVHRLLRAEGRGLADLLQPVRGADFAWGLLCGLIILVAWFPATFIGNLVAYQGPPPEASYGGGAVPLWLGLFAVSVMPVTIGLAEEALYRGYLQPRLQGRIGLVGAVLTASAVFALQHIGFALPDPRMAVASVVRTFLAGLVFAGLLIWRKRVMPLAVGHWLMDLLGLGLPLMASAVL
ncbi:CPBP family intramembrane glutamic endopeptidase [Actinomyces oricola]|uniref:CPBP family intramembrane glutamic endopeptidase n=1 Tax=Actinomyces oricola TaxID=206043 RepID=UPI000FFF164D|nr:CPBP family intramembrane glutamic endopeptidase [Actinomyces oricola]